MRNLLWYEFFDWPLFLSSLLLIILGSMMLLSTVFVPGEALLSNRLFLDHLFNISIGLFVFFVLAKIDYKNFYYFAIPLYIFGILLLALVPILGIVTRGSTRWIDFGIFNFQPSEFAKIIFTICLASFLVFIKDKIFKLKYVFLSILLMLPPILLILIQPDLGTALVLIIICLGLLFWAGVRWKHLFYLLLIVLFLLPLGWNFLADYQKARIMTFLDPTKDPLGEGYSVLQSMIAIGSGQIFGRGWGRGTQSHLQFLPERHTDFMFATFSEEFGFIGVTLLLTLFFILLFRLLKSAQETDDLFGRLLLIGFFSYFLFQIVVNIGMNLGAMPITGIPLPLVSYGGSSIVSILGCLGIAQSIIKKTKQRGLTY